MSARRRRPRQHADGNRLLLGMTLEVSRGAGRSLLGAFHAGHLCRSQRRADGDRRSPVPRPQRARRGRLRRRARPGRRDGRQRGRRLRAGRVPAARLPARGTRRAGTGITTGARRGRPAGNDRIARQGNVLQHSSRGQHHRHSSQPARRRPPGPPARQADVALAAANAAGQHWRTEVLPKLPALPAAYDRHATRTGRSARGHPHGWRGHQPRGIGRERVPGSGSAARSSRLVIAVEWPGITGRFRRPLIAMRTACPVTPLGGGPGQGAG